VSAENPLIGALPGDTFDNVRDMISLVQAALHADPALWPERVPLAMVKALDLVDAALATLDARKE